MTERDDFLANVRRAVALRAGYHCSFDGCNQLTVGPSEESPTAVARIGNAAHIHAASPGGKRYASSMTHDERKSIDNAIWMCPDHATLIDRDEVTYTADRLRAMKKAHEEAISRQLKSGVRPVWSADLIAIGPSLVCVGELVGTGGQAWRLRIDHFVIGDLNSLVNFGERFGHSPQADRYLLVNQLGDGRLLAGPPSWHKSGQELRVDVQVQDRFPRSRVQELGADMELTPDGDISPEGKMISGQQALPQKIQLCLSHPKDSLPWDNGFGTRLAEYYSLFHSSPWLGRLIKLEAIRLASIPHNDKFLKTSYTPFNCVERVLEIEPLASARIHKRLPTKVEFEINGLGSWAQEISLHIPDFPLPTRPLPPSMTNYGP